MNQNKIKYKYKYKDVVIDEKLGLLVIAEKIKGGDDFTVKLMQKRKVIINFNDYKSKPFLFCLDSKPFGCSDHKISLPKVDSYCYEAIKKRDKDFLEKAGRKEEYFYPLSILHEIGHIRAGTCKNDLPPRGTNKRIKIEKEAWLYAFKIIKKHMGELPYTEEEICCFAQHCIFSYKCNLEIDAEKMKAKLLEKFRMI